MSKKQIRILVVPSDTSGVGAFRSVKPHVALENMFPDEFKVDIDLQPQWDNDEYIKQYDIIHYHRTFGPYENMEETIQRFNKFGIIGIMDLDDYWSPGPHHPAYLIIKQNGLDTKLLNNIKLAQYLTTTTPIFEKEMQKFNKNTFVIPNAIDPKEKQYIPTPEVSDKIRVGFLGGSSHLRDLELLRGVVGRLKSDGLMDKIQFVLCGFDTRGTVTSINEQTGEQSVRKITPQESVWCKYEEIFTDNYSVISPEYKEYLMRFTKDEWHNVSNEPYRRVWTKPITTYASNYNLFDISLAPLEDNIFNLVKSALKVTEAGFHKKAIIAQNIGPYKFDTIQTIEKGGIINPNGNALLVDPVNNHKGWYENIKKLVKNPELIKMMAENLHNTIKDVYSIDAVTKVRADIYRGIIENHKK